MYSSGLSRCNRLIPPSLRCHRCHRTPLLPPTDHRVIVSFDCQAHLAPPPLFYPPGGAVVCTSAVHSSCRFASSAGQPPTWRSRSRQPDWRGRRVKLPAESRVVRRAIGRASPQQKKRQTPVSGGSGARTKPPRRRQPKDVRSAPKKKRRRLSGHRLQTKRYNKRVVAIAKLWREQHRVARPKLKPSSTRVK